MLDAWAVMLPAEKELGQASVCCRRRLLGTDTTKPKFISVHFPLSHFSLLSLNEQTNKETKQVPEASH